MGVVLGGGGGGGCNVFLTFSVRTVLTMLALAIPCLPRYTQNFGTRSVREPSNPHGGH